MIRENEQCYFFRKPQNLPSSWGKQQCFLDFLKDGNISSNLVLPGLLERIEKLGLTLVDEDKETIISRLLGLFSQDQEFGLLNRLDTPTQGLLYFAKNLDIYTSWKDRQQKGLISKYYIAETYGTVKQRDIGITFSMPLGHHTNGKKMHVLDATFLRSKRKQKMRGKKLEAKTTLVEAEYDHESDSTLIKIMIQKGQRHQIRAHLAYLGYPIVGESLYFDSPDQELHLWSIGCTVDLPVDVKNDNDT